MEGEQNAKLRGEIAEIRNSPCEIAVFRAQNGDFARGIAQNGYFNPYFDEDDGGRQGAAIAVGRDCGWTRLMAYIVVASLPSELYEEPEPLELLPEPLEPLPSWLSDFPEPPYC